MSSFGSRPTATLDTISVIIRLRDRVQNHQSADSLSRLPLLATETGECFSEVSVFNVAQMNTVAVSVTQLCETTHSDPVLYKYNISVFTKGWPSQINNVLKPYRTRWTELSVEEGCIMWGARVVIPKKLQVTILQMLHEGHVGVVRVKRITQSFAWWPGVNTDIEELVKTCKNCQQDHKSQEFAPHCTHGCGHLSRG